MIDLTAIPIILANINNYSPAKRKDSEIKYIVLHYTGNKNDTALNNCKYYQSNKVGASAHYYCDDTGIWCSVPPVYKAWAVGIGSRSEPYSKQSHWKKCTNSNSISIEMCGSKTSTEASSKTKQRACDLAVTLLKKYGLTPSAVIRHYDVTGKYCPWWAVEDKAKWLELNLEINKQFYGTEGKDDMIDSEENYQLFKKWMERLKAETAAEPATWEQGAMEWAASRSLINNGRPKDSVTRGELATVLKNMENQGMIS